MKRIITFLFVLIIILTMPVSAFALTPKFEYKAVKIPEIKIDTSFTQGIVANWFRTNPIDLPSIDISYTWPVLN